MAVVWLGLASAWLPLLFSRRLVGSLKKPRPPLLSSCGHTIGRIDVKGPKAYVGHPSRPRSLYFVPSVQCVVQSVRLWTHRILSCSVLFCSFVSLHRSFLRLSFHIFEFEQLRTRAYLPPLAVSHRARTSQALFSDIGSLQSFIFRCGSFLLLEGRSRADARDAAVGYGFLNVTGDH